MSNSNDAVRVISVKGLIKLQDLWLNYFHQGKRFKGGNAEQWFNVVVDFLSMRGDEIIPGALREQEERIITLGLSQEYMATLSEVVYSAGARTEYDKAVLVLTATPEERAEALQKVLKI